MPIQLEKICAYLLVTLLMLSGFSAYYRHTKGDAAPWLTSDIKALSPSLSSNKDIDQTLEKLRQGIENTVVVVLLSEDEDMLLEAQDALLKHVQEQASLYAVRDTEQLEQRITPLLLSSRFHLLSEQQANLLSHATDEQLLEAARRNVFGFGSLASTVSLAVDPFGFYGDYLLGILATVNGQGDSQLHDDGNYALVTNLDLHHNSLDLQHDTDVSAGLAELKNVIEATFADVELLYSGFALMAETTAKTTRSEITLITSLSSLGVIAVLLLSFSSVSVLLLPVLSVLVGVGGAFLFSYGVFGSVHLFTILFGASLIGVVVDYALHYLCHQKGASSQVVSSKYSGKKDSSLYRALFFSLLTSVIGYSALAFSSLASLKQVACFSVAGLSFAWLTVLSLGPYVQANTVRVLLPANVKASLYASLGYMGVALRFWPLTLVIALAVIRYLPVNHNDGAAAFFSLDPELLRQEQRVAGYIDAYEPGRFVVISGGSVADVQARIADFKHANKLEALALNSFYDWIPSRHQQQAYYALQSRLYGDQGLLAIWQKELGLSQEDVTALRMDYRNSADKSLDPLMLLQHAAELLPSTWLELGDRVYAVLRIAREQELTGMRELSQQDEHVFFVDTAEDVRLVLQQQRNSASQLLLAAYLLVACALLIRYRQASALAMLAVPALSSALVWLVCYCLSLPVTLFHVMALFLVLGLGMDYTIFIRDMHGDKAHRQAALKAISIACITSMISFGSLSLSAMGVVSGFGLTLLLGCMANLVFSFALGNSD